MNRTAIIGGGVLKTIADNCGYRGEDEIETIHQEMRKRFLPKHGRLNIPKSTTELSTAEMHEYIEAIRDWAMLELGIYIPAPNEVIED